MYLKRFKAISKLIKNVSISCQSVEKRETSKNHHKMNEEKNVIPVSVILSEKSVKIKAKKMDNEAKKYERKLVGIRIPNLNTLRFPSKTTNKFLTFRELIY